MTAKHFLFFELLHEARALKVRGITKPFREMYLLGIRAGQLNELAHQNKGG